MNKNKFLLSALLALTIVGYAHAGNFSILKDDRNITAVPGGDIVYDFHYSNYVGRDLMNVVLVDVIPANTTAVVTAGWTCAGYVLGDTVPAGTECKYVLGTVADGSVDQSLIGLITVTVDPTFTGELVVNTIAALENGTDELATSTVPTPVDQSTGPTTPDCGDDHKDNGNHYGNDKGDHNSRDDKNKHNTNTSGNDDKCKEHKDHGNHYGNDRDDNNPKDKKNKHNTNHD